MKGAWCVGRNKGTALRCVDTIRTSMGERCWQHFSACGFLSINCGLKQHILCTLTKAGCIQMQIYIYGRIVQILWTEIINIPITFTRNLIP